MGRKWGQKTAWAKSFFHPDSSPVESTSGSMAWRCNRCECVIHVAMDPHTERPAFVALAEHLEGTAPVSGVDACAVGPLRYTPPSPPPSLTSPDALDGLRRMLFGGDPIGVRVFVAVVNPKTPANMGSILRAVGCFGADGFIFSGSRLLSALGHRPPTDTHAAGVSVPHCAIPDMMDLFDALRGVRRAVVAIDLIDGAVPLPALRHPFLEKDALGVARNGEGDRVVIYLFGAEDSSIPQEIVSRCDAAALLPTRGSLNLAAAVNVVLYDRCVARLGREGDAALMEACASAIATRNANNRTEWNVAGGVAEVGEKRVRSAVGE